jgi:hypothetical protein
MNASAPALLRRGEFWGAICLALVGSGCVLPIGPEFQDPPAPQNYAPIILEAEPELGRRVTTPTFRVTVQDPNPGDDLFVRFVADYPLLTEDTRPLTTRPITHRADGRLLAEDVTVTATCTALASRSSHQITVIVADRDFLKDAAPPGQLSDPLRLPAAAQRVLGSWTLDLECP